MVQAFEQAASELRNIYWRIRMTRDVNRRRTYYRWAAKEKAALAALGWNLEVIRLYALAMRNPSLQHRYGRFLALCQVQPYEPDKPMQLELF